MFCLLRDSDSAGEKERAGEREEETTKREREFVDFLHSSFGRLSLW